GADGITIRGWGASDYVPLARIAHHSVVGSGGSPHYALVLGCGQRSHTLPMSSASAAHALSDAIAVALSSRRPASPPLWLTDRGERSLRDWVARLRRQDAAGLRDPAPSKSDLFRVVEDGSAQPIDRASAAIALGRSLSEDDRRRLAEIT